ncbi:MAG TPA: glycerophosphoryl diester phosphodiesterase membrane domain-containing protein [Actinomycetota bacterium]|nr:glycerophosphoryl diester phosphodiesterase membrane domain-containing protein [Actinomycetota bacterium]
MGGPPLAGATAIDYRGTRFALGRTADMYGIWDMPAGGGPVISFPLTHDGWAEAWRTYRYWEETAGAPPPGPPPAYPTPVATAGGPVGTQVTGPLTFANIIEVAARLYGRHAATLILLMAAVLIPLSLLQTAVIQAALGPFARFAQSGVAPLEDVREILPRFLLVTLGVTILGFVINGFLTAAVTGAAVDATSGGEVSVRRSAGAALRRLHSVLWVLFLQTLAVLAVLIVPALVVIAGAGAESGALIVVGSVLAVPPLLFVLIRLLFSVPVLMAEDRRGWAALARSWRLVSGRWWRTFGIFLLVGLIAGLVGLLFQAIAQALTPGTAAGTDAAAYIGALGSGIAASLTSPFIILVIVLLYLDARFRTAATLGGPAPGPGA